MDDIASCFFWVKLQALLAPCCIPRSNYVSQGTWRLNSITVSYIRLPLDLRSLLSRCIIFPPFLTASIENLFWTEVFTHEILDWYVVRHQGCDSLTPYRRGGKKARLFCPGKKPGLLQRMVTGRCAVWLFHGKRKARTQELSVPLWLSRESLLGAPQTRASGTHRTLN